MKLSALRADKWEPETLTWKQPHKRQQNMWKINQKAQIYFNFATFFFLQSTWMCLSLHSAAAPTLYFCQKHSSLTHSSSRGLFSLSCFCVVKLRLGATCRCFIIATWTVRRGKPFLALTSSRGMQSRRFTRVLCLVCEYFQFMQLYTRIQWEMLCFFTALCTIYQL